MDASTGSSGGSTDGVGSSTGGSLDDTGTDSSTDGTTELPVPLPPLDGVPTTVEERIEPTHVIETTPTLDPREPELRQQLLDEGYGDFELAPGETVVDLTPGGRAPLDPGPDAAMVSRFVHLADTQITDDESPLRLVEVDSLFISGAFRPQETHGCQITNAAVRTINAVHAQTPLDFVVLGGDNADSAQTNEVQWFLDVEERVRPLLDAAEAEGKLVLVSSHHASGTLTDGSGLGGDPVPGALDPADWRAFLADYPNVLAHLCGHSHVHQAEYIQPMGTRGYWEVITAAIADWPHQMRVVEVHDQDNGWLTITGIALDYATQDDALAADARALGILDFTSNWVIDGAGMAQDRNVRLWVAAP